MNTAAKKQIFRMLDDLKRTTHQISARRKTTGLVHLSEAISHSSAAENPGPPVIELTAALLIAEYKALLAEERTRKDSPKVSEGKAVKPKRKLKEKTDWVKEGLSFDFATKRIVLPDGRRIRVLPRYLAVLKLLLQKRKDFPNELAVVTLEKIAGFTFERERLKENAEEDESERAAAVRQRVNAATKEELKETAKAWRRLMGRWFALRRIDPDAVLTFDETEQRYELGPGWKAGKKCLENRAEKSLSYGAPDSDDESAD